MNKISEEFRKLLYDLLSKYSIGNIQFGVLKTFYENEDVLYDEIIDELPKDEHLNMVESALKQDGVHVFMMHIIEAGDAFNNLKNLSQVPAEFWFDNQVSLIVLNKLMEKSKSRMRSEITIEGVLSNMIPNAKFIQTVIDKINDALSEYGCEVTKCNTPPTRFLNKEEHDEYMNNGFHINEVIS